MTIDRLELGREAVILRVGGEGSTRTHFLGMGLTPGTRIKVIKRAPMGDPIEIQVRGYALTLRKSDAAGIEVHLLEEGTSAETSEPLSDKGYNAYLHEHNAHPGLGEGGKYHSRDHEHPLPKDTVLSFALAGQQNCGKTTLFNQLTGSSQHVGNFPGVTVDRKSGVIRGYPGTSITDLPGIYSLTPYTAEELVSREFILDDETKGLINIVDAGNIERNLYLTLQLMELEVPMVLALNMMDEVRGNGGSIRINEMERILGIPVVGISAARGEGVDELVEHAVHVARYQEKPARTDFCAEDDHGGAVHRCLHGVMHLVEDHARAAGIPLRFAASKLIEGDAWVENALKLDRNEKEMIEHIILQMEQERGLDRAAAIADMRYNFIQRLCAETVVKPRESREYLRSRRIDRVLTGKWTAIPIFLAVMSLVIWLTIDVLGAPLQDLLDCQRGRTLAGRGCRIRRRGLRGEFRPDHHHPVLLPFHAGRQRLYGARGLRDRPCAPQDRPFGAEHRPAADRPGLLRAGRDGDAHAAVRQGPHENDPAYPVHELLGQTADLCLLYQRLLPGTRGIGARLPVPAVDPGGHRRRAD